MSTEETKKKTWGDLLDEVKVIRLKLEKFSKLSLAQELAVNCYCYGLPVDSIVKSLQKQEHLSKAIRATVRAQRVIDAIDQGKPIPYTRKKRRRRARRRQRLTTND